MLRTIFLLLLITCGAPLALADVVRFRVCSQNLKRYSSNETAYRPVSRARLFSEAFIKHRCDLIAVQELLGENEADATTTLRHFSSELTKLTRESYDYFFGPRDTTSLKLAFLLRRDPRFAQPRIQSFHDRPLPRLSPRARLRMPLRGPLLLHVDIVQSGFPSLSLRVLNFHLKSKRHFPPDPAGMKWEGYRMEMAEQLRMVVEEERKHDRGKSTVFLVVGDRNSNADSASALVMEGQRHISDFQSLTGCRVLEDFTPSCPRPLHRTPILRSLFSKLRVRSDVGTYLYKDSWNWLDDILVLRTNRYTASGQRYSLNYKAWVKRLPTSLTDHSLLISEVRVKI